MLSVSLCNGNDYKETNNLVIFETSEIIPTNLSIKNGNCLHSGASKLRACALLFKGKFILSKGTILPRFHSALHFSHLKYSPFCLFIS